MRVMLKYILLLGVILMAGLYLNAQKTDTTRKLAFKSPELGPNDTITVYLTQLENGEWVPTSALPDVDVKTKMPRKVRREKEKYDRLRNAVYVTYPYAISASRVFTEINQQLKTVTTDADRHRIIKSKEKELKKEFGDKITQLSVYQGRVLMKLIYRETGIHCYDILKEYKGGANARFWQTIAFFFGGNLKQTYRPQGEDAQMERFVKEVEQLYYPYGR